MVLFYQIPKKCKLFGVYFASIDDKLGSEIKGSTNNDLIKVGCGSYLTKIWK